MMNESGNAHLVSSYFEALSKGDLSRLDDLLDDKIIWHQPGSGKLAGTYCGKASLVPLITLFMELSEGTYQIDRVESVAGDGNLVAARLRFNAQTVEDAAPVPADSVDLMRIELGKITEVWHFSRNQLAA